MMDIPRTYPIGAKLPMPTFEWQDLDVFFWSYKDSLGSQYDKYWCACRIAIVKDGMLYDIFWSNIDGHKVTLDGQHGRRFTREEAELHLDLDFKGNLNDFDVIPDCKALYYDHTDILSLKHSNSSRNTVYVRRGATRRRESLLAEISRRVEKAERDARWANQSLEELAKQKSLVEAGDLENVYL